MKVLFLDVDGVLNNREDLEKNGPQYVCDEKIGLLKSIVDETDVEIILSSTWRYLRDPLKYLKWRLKKQNLKIKGKTPQSPKMSLYWSRGQEIQAWLDSNEVEDFVIVDDDIDANIEGHFF